MKYAAIRERAAQIIERDGWWDGTGEPGKKRCALTALKAACVDLGFPTSSAVYRSVEHELDGDPWLPDWNDAPGRTVAEVLAALRGGVR